MKHSINYSIIVSVIVYNSNIEVIQFNTIVIKYKIGYNIIIIYCVYLLLYVNTTILSIVYNVSYSIQLQLCCIFNYCVVWIVVITTEHTIFMGAVTTSTPLLF